MSNNKRLFRICGIAIFSVFIAALIYITVHAATGNRNDAVVSKTLMQGVERCYDEGAIANKTTFSMFNRSVSILSSSARTVKINIPNGLIGSLPIKQGQISCYELFAGAYDGELGAGDLSSILTGNVTLPSYSDASKGPFLESMGYEPVYSNEHCMHVLYLSDSVVSSGVLNVPLTRENHRYTHSLCAEVDADGKIASKLSVKTDGSGDIVEFELNNNDHAVQLDCAVWFPGYGGCTNWDGSVGTSWEALKNAIFNDLAENRPDFWGAVDNYTWSYEIARTDDVLEDTNIDYYQLKPNAKEIALTTLTGSPIVPDITNDEVALLYVTYLKNVYGTEQVCNLTENQLVVYSNQGFIEYRPNSDGHMCYIRATKNKTQKVNGAESGKMSYENKDFDSIVNWLKNYTGTTNSDLDTAATLDPALVLGESTGYNGAQACYDHAGALAWVLCPMVGAIEGVMDTVYGWIETNYLQVNPVLFDSSTGTHQAWGALRDIANVVFILMTLIVVFSQVTGIGIDNYGIKKLIPRIIISALIMNLSFIVCSFLADLSNILGNSLNTMLSDAFGIESGITSNVNVGAAAATGFIVGGLGISTIVGAFYLNPGLIITVLFMLLAAVCAILFLWIILVARQAALILAIVISPLAFVCLLLPNTEKWFKRWTSLMVALFTLYPLCGLVIGGGRFASTILFSVGASAHLDALNLAAVIVQVLPYFFIPALLRGSLNIIGNLGARISNLGRAFSGATVGRASNSDAVKNAQTRMRAGVDRNGRLTGMGELRARIARRTGFGRNSMARAQNAAERQRNEDTAANAMLLGSVMDAREALDPRSVAQREFQNRLDTAILNDNEEEYYALMDESIRRFGVSKAAEMYRNSVTSQYGNGLMSAENSSRFLRNSSKRYGAQFQSKDYALGKYMQMGGIRGTDGLRQNLTDFEDDGDNLPVGDMKDEQAAQLNSNSIERAQRSGYATQEMAQRIMANRELRRGMDDVQQLQWAYMANTGHVMGKNEATHILSGGRHGGFTGPARISQAAAQRMIAPLPDNVNVVDGDIRVSSGSITLAGGTVDQVRNVDLVHDVNQVNNVREVENVHNIENVQQVQNVVNTENVQRVQDVHNVANVQYVENVHNTENVEHVQNVDGTVDVNIRDVNTNGAPQTQPLQVTSIRPKPVSPPPVILGPDGRPIVRKP